MDKPDYGEEITFLWQATKHTVLDRLVIEPSANDSVVSLQKLGRSALELLQESWRGVLDRALDELPREFRRLVVEETRLGVHFYDRPHEEKNVAIAFVIEFAPLLAKLFPIQQTLPTDGRLVLEFHSEVSWKTPPLNLYWVDHPLGGWGWFVVGPTPDHAQKYYESFKLACEDGQLVVEWIGSLTERVSEQCHHNRTSWASMESLWCVNATLERNTIPRVVRVGERDFTEGSRLVAHLQVMQQQQEEEDRLVQMLAAKTPTDASSLN